ncbi:MAG: DNA repair protein RecO [Zoogloeaceae bacterium]|jgi:DNA repair protein RecO (recombination protein O)|nr:DNA repair protein RecO [Zoogloeaceae bacterium]
MRIDAQPAYVLHTRPWRETSLLAEIFSRNHGRVALLARGARRPQSPLRGLLMGFQPLALSWSGKGEVKTLIKAEWQGGQPLLSGQALFCGYYLNELLMRLLPREDAHPLLFEGYARILLQLAFGEGETEAPLRAFERALLGELGYGLTLTHDRDGAALEAESRYHYAIESGSCRVASGTPGSVAGQTLLDMATDDYRNPATRGEAKQLMRRLLAHYLEGVELESRKLFQA